MHEIIQEICDMGRWRLEILSVLNWCRVLTGVSWGVILSWLFSRTWAPYIELYNELQITSQMTKQLESEVQDCHQVIDILEVEAGDHFTPLPKIYGSSEGR